MLKKMKYPLLCFIGLLWLPSAFAKQCVLTMGYRTSERLPYIQKAPSNDGFYFDLYDKAAKRIGCRLEILRAPKKRILRELEFGRIDFYPNLNYSPKRNKIAHFIANGLPSNQIGISRRQDPEVTDINQLLTRNKTLLIAPGSHIDGGLPKHLSTRQPPEMDIRTAIELILQKSGDFFIYEEASIRYHLTQFPNPEIKIHHKCCVNNNKMYLGFSKMSPYYASEPNADYDRKQPLSPTNQPEKLLVSSKANQFAKSLSRMHQLGITVKLRDLYFNNNQKRYATHVAN
ncbi:substrate-binding periplasmic protein [Shewanella gelidii]|uniref:ABC transporter substrate-binding protein n=1 Tax=Shewanella gelidii TaxID=1642821 RepID=A0A917JVZ7_9GAMM|nr:transporter substrate-binding domain-containing protein [Shewanella gelidii]MCL1098779.1 transporter substrate-binding domain-containing protein [Shewanella gelidii]GGI87705.1 ABC transporter substrate-binding protein [Shewanella gelidii]